LKTDKDFLTNCTDLIRGTYRNNVTTTDGWVRIPSEVQNE